MLKIWQIFKGISACTCNAYQALSDLRSMLRMSTPYEMGWRKAAEKKCNRLGVFVVAVVVAVIVVAVVVVVCHLLSDSVPNRSYLSHFVKEPDRTNI